MKDYREETAVASIRPPHFIVGVLHGVFGVEDFLHQGVGLQMLTENFGTAIHLYDSCGKVPGIRFQHDPISVPEQSIAMGPQTRS